VLPAGACLLLLLLTACSAAAPGPAQEVRIDRVQFENRSSTSIDSIRLLVAATGNFVSCGHIAPKGVCAAAFPQVVYQGYPVQVSWVQGGEQWSTGEASLTVDDAASAAGVGEVRVVVLAPGSAGVILLAEPAGR